MAEVRKNSAKLCNSIFIRRYRLTQRRELLHRIVMGEGAELDDQDDEEMVQRLEDAFRVSVPRYGTPVAKILLRYSFHLGEYFHVDMISPLSPKLLGQIMANFRDRFAEARNILESEIQQDYKRNTKKAAFDFILKNGAASSFQTPKFEDCRSLQSSLNSATIGFYEYERPRFNAHTRRLVARKMCYQHFFGKRMVELWHRYIRSINWSSSIGSLGSTLEIETLKAKWDSELKEANHNLKAFWKIIIKHFIKYILRKKGEFPIESHAANICLSVDTLVGMLLQNWCQDNITNFTSCLNGSEQHGSFVFVTHVTVNGDQLEFSPSVEEINNLWMSFCEHLSHSSDRTVYSVNVAFELIRQDGSTLNQRSYVHANVPPDFTEHHKEMIFDTFRHDGPELNEALKHFEKFSVLLEHTYDQGINDIIKNGASFKVLTEKLAHYQRQLRLVQDELHQTLHVGRYEIKLNRLKGFLEDRVTAIINLILDEFSRKFANSATEICRDYAEYADLALTVPQTTAQWIFQRESVHRLIHSTLPLASRKIRETINHYIFLCDQMQVSEANFTLAKEVLLWKRRMHAAQIEHGRLLRRKRIQLEADLKLKRETVNNNLKTYNTLMTTIQRCSDIESLGQYVEQARSLLHRLNEAQDQVTRINEEELHFGWIVTEYPVLHQVKERLVPFLDLFEHSYSFLNQQQQWLSSRLGSFDPEIIVKETEFFQTNLAQVQDVLPDIQDVRVLVAQVELKLREFHKVLPLIRTLGNPALRERHWEQIWDTVGVRLSSEAASSLQQLLALQLNKYLKKIEVISYAATQEMSLENSLIRMKNQWSSYSLPVETYRGGEGRVLGNVDQLQRLVEDHIIETQVMRRSPYVKPFEKDAREWEQQLNDMQLLLEHCVFIQDRWCRLEPLLTSPDMLSAAPDEARKFFAIDKSWREVLTAIGLCKQIFSLLFAEHISERLGSCIQQIQTLEKNLHNVLECKRQQYPRFFLLAEDELKELLSFSRDPRRFSASLWRLYEGVHDLEFNDEGNDVTLVISPIGERLTLHEPVNYTKCKGQLDKFLNKLEVALKFTLCQIITDAVGTFDGSDMTPLFELPSQIAVLIAKVHCTRLIDSALSSNQPDDLQLVHQWLLNAQETLKNSPEKAHQLTGESLALTALYYRDLIDSIIEEKSGNLNESETWTAALKYRVNEGRVEIHVLTSALHYGMEYIGQPPAMVGHSDSRQILSTITSSFKYRVMGILIGTARLELMETLSHCVGQRLGRFDCSSYTTTEDVLRQIRGAITCGVWLCYNHLNLLQTSVSSYMSSLLTQMQNVDYPPSWLELADTNNIPHYGIFGFVPSDKTAEIVEPNLKRSVHIDLPNFGYVAEILFPRHGRQIAHCVQQFLEKYDQRLSSDPLSKLETLQQISNTARHVDLPRALISWGSCRIAADHLSDFVDLVTESFPELNESNWQSKPLIAQCKAACESLQLHFSDHLLWKISHLSDAYEHKVPTLLYGPSHTGKTSLMRIFCQSYSSAHNETLSMDHICTGAFTENDLMSNNTRSIIPQMIRSCAGHKKIIVLDGQFIVGVQDRLLDALSKERILCLRSTEQVVLPDNVHFVFELNADAACQAISPHHIARCRLIYLDNAHVKWSCLIKSWIKTIPPVVAFLEQIFNLLLPPLLEYNSKMVHHSTSYHPIRAVGHMLPLIGALIQPSFEPIAKNKNQVDNETRQYLQGCVIFSVIWTLGVPGYIQDREGFHDFFFDLMEDAFDQNMFLPAVRFPDQGKIFDYKLVREQKCVWQLWNEDLRVTQSLSRELPTNELFIPTVDSVRAQHLMSLFITSKVPCVIIGANAVGKTATVTNYLRHKLNQAAYEVLIINTSQFLRARTAQSIFMGKMERRRKCVYGPALGKKAVVFFDDIHSESLSKDGCDRVNMLLKQCIQHGQIFESDDGRLSNLVDISFLAASELSDKPIEVLSHFAPVILEPLTMETVTGILNKMMLWHLDARGFGKEFDSSINQLITACLTIYQMVIDTGEFARYSWNLRDALRCIHGLLLSVPEAIEDVPAMKRLWVHEALRVFSDRLCESYGMTKVIEYVETVCEEHLKATVKELLSHLELADPADMVNMNTSTIFFCDFSDPKADTRSYTEVIDMEHLHKVVGGYLREYNNMTRRPMHYFNIFRFFVRTMSKSTRVLRHPRGHLVLVGPVGVGRHSVSRMAGHASDSEVHQFEMGNEFNYSEWLDTFKTALIRAATEDKRSVFILSDVEFEFDDCKALINHVVNSGDVMHLFSTDERVDLVEKMRAIDLQKEKSLQTDGSVAALKEMFEARMWEQMRIIVVLRSTADLAKVFQTCPQFGTSCQTVYAHPWPVDTVEDVVLRTFKELDLEEERKPGLVDLVNSIHLVTRSSDKVVYEYGLFMEFVSVTAVLTEKYKEQLKYRQQICVQAVEKLDEAARRVTAMEEELDKWRNDLDRLRASPETGETAEKIKRTEQDIEMLSCSIDRAKDLLANLSNYCAEWRTATVVLQTRIACCHLDCTLTASIMTCCARLTEADRINNFETWKYAAQSNGHIFSELAHYLTLVGTELRETAACWTMANLPTDEHCIASGVALRYVQRVPLMVDPHHVAIKWITAVALQKEIKPTFLNMSAPDYLEQLASCLQLGAMVVIDITEIEFDTAIIPLLLKQTFNQGTTNYIKLGPNTVEYAAEFQLYLRSQTPVTDEKVLLCVTVIDFTLEDPGILETLVSALVNNERPDHEERIQLAKQMLELVTELDDTELNLLKILSQTDNSWIENDQIITNLLPSVTQSKLFKDKLETFEQTKKRMEVQRQTFAPTAIFAADILTALGPMTKFYKQLHFPLERFANTIVTCLEDSDDGDEDFDSTFSSIRKLTGRIYRKLKLGFNRHHRAIAAIMMAVCVAQSENLCDSSFYTQFVNNRVQFPADVPADENWVQWIKDVSEDRLSISTLSDFFTRKFLRISQRIEFSECAMAVMDFPNATPVLILIERGLNMLSIISRMGKELDFPDDRIRYTAVSGLDSLNWTDIEDCVRRGNWYVLQGFAHLNNMVRNVHTLLEHLNVDYMSPEFRLWIVWGFDDETNPPCILLEHARSLYFESVHTAEDCYLDVTTLSELDMFLTVEHENIDSNLKFTMVAMIIVLRIALWDRLNIVVPATEIMGLLKEMVRLLQGEAVWPDVFKTLVSDAVLDLLTDQQVLIFQRDILSDLLQERNESWVKAVQLLKEKWSNPTETSCELTTIFDLITVPENESRRQIANSEEIWRFLNYSFANPVNDMV